MELVDVKDSEGVEPIVREEPSVREEDALEGIDDEIEDEFEDEIDVGIGCSLRRIEELRCGVAFFLRT